MTDNLNILNKAEAVMIPLTTLLKQLGCNPLTTHRVWTAMVTTLMKENPGDDDDTLSIVHLTALIDLLDTHPAFNEILDRDEDGEEFIVEDEPSPKERLLSLVNDLTIYPTIIVTPKPVYDREDFDSDEAYRMMTGDLGFDEEENLG